MGVRCETRQLCARRDIITGRTLSGVLIGVLIGLMALVTGGRSGYAVTTGTAIVQGWNLIALPVQNSSLASASALTASLDASLGSAAVQVLAIYAGGRFQITVPGYSSDNPLQPSQGIYVLSKVAGTWSPPGTAYSSGQPISLHPGWNLIAAPYPSGGLMSSAVAQEAGCQATEIATYAGGSYQTWMPGAADVQIPSTRGFWMLCTAPATWTPYDAVTIPATADIYAAGLTAVPALEYGGGTLPVRIPVVPGQMVSFPVVNGTVGCDPNQLNGPDGGTCVGTPVSVNATDVTPYGGLSGFIDSQATLPLVGVFLTSSGQPAAAPSTLDFSPPPQGLGQDFTSLSPELGQVFFIGDGKADTSAGAGGAVQQFRVPSNAAELYLGFADAYQVSGPPAYYSDNVGALMAAWTLAAG